MVHDYIARLSFNLSRALRAVDARDTRLSSERALKRADDRAVIHLTNDNTARILLTVFKLAVALILDLRYEAVDAHGHNVCDMHYLCDRVRAIISGRYLIAPMVFAGRVFICFRVGHRMAILSLAVKDLAELARVVYSLELKTLLRIRVIFRDHIDLSRLLNGTAKRNALSKSGHSRTL